VTIGDNVSSIGEAAFHECTGLTSIIIPDSVTSIGDYAFSNCTSLTTVLIPDSVTRIGGFAFAGCTSLSSIRIPSSVNEWGRVEILFTMGIVLMSSPFSGCITLTSVMVDDGVQAIPDRAFLGCTGLTSVTIPDSVTSIGDWAFSGTGLTSVTIPDSVTSIGDRAFSGCTGLTSITIPNSVTSIGDYAFNSCAGLTSVTIPDSVTSIGGEAFNGCTRLASVYFRGDSPEGPEAFYDCPTTIYYLPGTTGWGATFSDRPTARWVLPNPVILGFGPSFGVRTNQFGFIISWAMNDIPVAVEACSDSTQSSWAPVGSVTLNNGSAYFSDADWANHPVRFYRVRSD
ncbi:MAG TPA: leucine-rich repeat domain-containing protein, partial [Candidatus Paceibacterota bacterium]|nr:leucine-rich repeat domain-containing protein [Candidatus Paceibacterota bacterium]